MRYQTCVYCHTAIPVDRFEYASDGHLRYRICPECDHTILLMNDEQNVDAPVLLQAKQAEGICE